MRALVLLAALTLTASHGAQAQTPAQALPTLVTRALAAFQAKGPEAGIKALTPNWNTIDDEGKQRQLIDGFTQIQEFAGPLLGYDLARRFDVSAHVAVAYIVLLFEHQPVFLVLTIYSVPGRDVMVTAVDYHTIADKVFPAVLLEPTAQPGRP